MFIALFSLFLRMFEIFHTYSYAKGGGGRWEESEKKNLTIASQEFNLFLNVEVLAWS